MMFNDRIAVYESLNDVLNNGAYSNLSINRMINKYEVYSSSYIRNYAKGVLRYLMLLDFNIDKLSQKGVKSIKTKDLILLRMGIYEIMFSKSIPNYATVNEIVEIAKKKCKGRDKFINGILRSFIREKDNINLPNNNHKELSIKESFPLWIVEMIIDQYGENDGKEIIKGLNIIPSMTLRINKLKVNREDVLKKLNNTKAYDINDNMIIVNEGDIISSKEYKDGEISVQGVASINAINVLNPKPGAYVLDMCAAPGGKTTYMAEIMDNKGLIVACDIYENRLRLIANETKRLSIDIIKTKIKDGCLHDKEMNDKFDYVLADVPCSGMGVINKKPEIKYNINEAELKDLQVIQLKILENACNYVKVGGNVLYSTCTINKDENDGIIDKFLLNNDKFNIVEKYTALPYNGKVDGFFYCKLCRLN